MPVFRYIASDASGKEQTGHLEGDTAKKIRQQLRAKGLLPIDVDVTAQEKQKSKAIFSRRVSQSAMSMMTREFASLISAGMPIDEALYILGEQADNQRLKQVLLAVRAKLMEGYSLAKSLGEFPRVFPPVYCHSVSAGEASGHLANVLERLADYTERTQEIKQKITQALIYPMLMTVTSIVVITFLLAMVVPKMIAVFEDQGQTLPLPTKILLTLSNGLQHYGLYLLSLIVIGLIIFQRALQKPVFKRRWHELKLKVPLLKRNIRTINTARYAQTLGMLVSAGIPIIEAMKISQEMITNIPIREAVKTAAIKVGEGASIHQSLKQTGYFAPVMIHFIASGEKSGRLEDMLQRAAAQQDRQVTMLIDTGLSIFEPILILVMGLVVLFIVLAILLPMFEMTQLVG